ncbi:MAG: cytidine deaminase [bacterium]|nr:MAG: cytidine deaminase [bacterium]
MLLVSYNNSAIIITYQILNFTKKEFVEIDLEKLARQVRNNAIAPFSNFQVGAALLTTDGIVFTGCNIENATFGLTVCAERVALFKAISEGKRDFKKITIVTDSSKLSLPCGACRQLLWEFCGDIEVEIVNLQGGVAFKRVKELLPLPFDKSNFFEPGDK